MPHMDLPLIAIVMRIILPPIMFIGIIGNLLNIMVLKRSTLYNHPCSHYFLALSSNNLFASTFILTYNLLATGYQMDPTVNSRVWCKIIIYTQQLCVFLSPYFIILASVDRYFSSSSNIHLRNLSNLTFARWFILSVILFYSLFFISSFAMLEIQPAHSVPCRISTTTLYGRIYPFIQSVLLNLIPPLLMLVFGLLTIRNTKLVRVIPVVFSRYRRTEQQLARMLVVQVICHFVLNTPMCTLYVLGFLPVQVLSPRKYFVAFRTSQLIYSFSYATSIFLYFFSSRVYREELMIVLRNLIQLKRHNQFASVYNSSKMIEMKLLRTSTTDQ